MKLDRVQRAFSVTVVLLMVLMTSAIVYAGVVSGPGDQGRVKNQSGSSTLPKVVKPELTIDHAYGTYFAPAKLTATLKTGNTGVNNSEISFFVDGKLVGKALTGTDGKAHKDYTVPATLKDKSKIRAEGAGLVAEGTIGLIKRAVKLSAVVDPPKPVAPRTFKIGGRLLYESGWEEPNTGGRKIRVVVGNDTYYDTTSQIKPGGPITSNGFYEITHTVPATLPAGSKIAVQAFFDGDNECCLQNAASDPATILVEPPGEKPAPKKPEPKK